MNGHSFGTLLYLLRGIQTPDVVLQQLGSPFLFDEFCYIIVTRRLAQFDINSFYWRFAFLECHLGLAVFIGVLQQQLLVARCRTFYLECNQCTNAGELLIGGIVVVEHGNLNILFVVLHQVAFWCL